MSDGVVQAKSIAVALCAVAVKPVTCDGISPSLAFADALSAPVPKPLIALTRQYFVFPDSLFV